MTVPNFNKRTKIIATIGPSSSSKEIMSQLIDTGVNVFRFNMKHNELEWHEEKINLAKQLSKEKDIPVGILIDLQGPEVRIKTKEGAQFSLSKDEEFILSHNDEYLNEAPKSILVSDAVVTQNLSPNDTFTIDDGKHHFVVSKVGPDFVIAHALNECIIETNKSLNLVQKDLPLPSLTEKDITKLNFASKLGVDFVALSFVRSREDIETLREKMDKRRIKAKIVSKVESQKGIDNIDSIIDASDAVMIARGDLGIETPIEAVTYFQKETIKKCREKLKTVIVATQMLETMITSPMPSRAEAADVSNAVFDSTDCTMLSGETASGKYPVLAASTMSKILAYNEQHVFSEHYDSEKADVTKKIAHAVYSVSRLGGIDKIVAITSSGYTASILSALRPRAPIIAITENHSTYGQLTMSYGVFPYLSEDHENDIFSYDKIIKFLLHKNVLAKGEKIVITHGQKTGSPGKTNSMVFLEI